jgi:ATP-dependent Clp protease ATP-binding subunit ClpC
MTWPELRKKAVKEYHPILLMERLTSHAVRSWIYKLIQSLMWLLLLMALVVYAISKNTKDPAMVTAAVKIVGLFCIVWAMWIIATAVRAFYFSYYFKGIPDRPDDPKPIVSYELALVFFRTHHGDVLSGLFKTREGKFILRRAGISAHTFQKYNASRKNVLVTDKLTFTDAEYITFAEYAEKIFDADEDFAGFLFAHGIQKKDFLAICDWVVERESAEKHRARWWSRERLGRVPGIGKGWSYGQTFNLERYIRPLPHDDTPEYEMHDVFGTAELKELEAILVRDKDANVFLVGDAVEGKLEIISRLAAMIEAGTAFPELQHKKIIMLDTDIILAATKSKGEFESEFMLLMREAQYAGNIILVFPNFPEFIASAGAIGADVVSLLDPFLASTALQMIGLSDMERFHAVLERNPLLMQRFDKIIIEESDELNTVRILENEIIAFEHRQKLFFTYLSLTSVAESADRYIATGIMPDKAIVLLHEIAGHVMAKGKRIVHKQDVLEVVQTKTGIPVGDVTGAERDKLLNLEKILHQRIIGQDEAVMAIANAVRRARSGINNPNRPIASFLFLGPTGVGKTESTKALAEAFFGSDAKIERLDMSEYSSSDSVGKLIGSREGVGVLTAMVKQHPYGVLLLDEFEKTTPEVMNVFLQILDEGFYSDENGKHVNTRNLLIIATSNAGSELIWDAVKKGDDLNEAKDIIVDSIIHAGIFKPELLNRFDGVIVFHPLAKEHLEKIAMLQLGRLKKRMAERGINLVINQDLVDYVMRFGVDPKFGARPMNRAIQDKVEQIIATKLIKGEAWPGSQIVITSPELEKIKT